MAPAAAVSSRLNSDTAWPTRRFQPNRRRRSPRNPCNKSVPPNSAPEPTARAPRLSADIRPAPPQDALRLAYLWLVHVLVAIPIVAPIVWLARHRVRWHWWEVVVFVLPFSCWLGLVFANWRPKTLANLGECFVVSVAIIVAGVLRTLLDKASERTLVPVTTQVMRETLDGQTHREEQPGSS
jgi:hypothetical protein